MLRTTLQMANRRGQKRKAPKHKLNPKGPVNKQAKALQEENDNNPKSYDGYLPCDPLRDWAAETTLPLPADHEDPWAELQRRPTTPSPISLDGVECELVPPFFWLEDPIPRRFLHCILCGLDSGISMQQDDLDNLEP
ncbi:hypothetical protein AWENTII_011413 [Aspergillus wentii]|nr:hypothetical protein MW887_003879 [Aspergillus wentii]